MDATATGERAIGLSRTKIVLIMLGAGVLVAGGVWLLQFDAAEARAAFAFASPPMIRAIGAVSVAFFGAVGVYGFWKLFDDKPGLEFSSAGVIDNSSAVAVGLIPWTDIQGVEVIEMHGQKMLVVKLRDARRYVERGGRLRRALNRETLRMCGSPIVISSNALRIDFAELVELFERYREAYATG